MAKAPKEKPQHVDRLGKPLKEGDPVPVAVAHANGLIIATITKINAKMLRVHNVQKSKYQG